MIGRESNERPVDQFEAVDDEGQSYTVVQLETVFFDRDSNGNLVTIPGLRRFMLTTGENVNALEDGTFQIFETGKIIRRKIV